ncbi:hypothetical protein Tsubulata_044878 [Turnera subulata]|uniref:Uncharacterized protein n=1 Tax=Turnera subulata TaxID=218843 RepID=A0A9Q0JM87_9ROSI|nr:hypothetical protein Tsubulata_044878 [Turnera subulata]
MGGILIGVVQKIDNVGDRFRFGQGWTLRRMEEREDSKWMALNPLTGTSFPFPPPPEMDAGSTWG